MPIILPPHCASLWFHNVAPTLKGTIALRMRQYLPRCPFRSAASTCRDALQHDDWFSQTPFVRPGHKAYILRVLPRTLLPSHVGENRCHICCNFVANVNWGSCSNFSALRKRPDLTARSLCHWTWRDLRKMEFPVSLRNGDHLGAYPKLSPVWDWFSLSMLCCHFRLREKKTRFISTNIFASSSFFSFVRYVGSCSSTWPCRKGKHHVTHRSSGG